MKLGVFTVVYQDRPLPEVLDVLAAKGVETVELGTGNYPGADHCDPVVLLDDTAAQRGLLDQIEARGMMISALSCHGTPLHPDESIAQAAHETWRNTVRLAVQLAVPV